MSIQKNSMDIFVPEYYYIGSNQHVVTYRSKKNTSKKTRKNKVSFLNYLVIQTFFFIFCAVKTFFFDVSSSLFEEEEEKEISVLVLPTIPRGNPKLITLFCPPPPPPSFTDTSFLKNTGAPLPTPPQSFSLVFYLPYLFFSAAAVIFPYFFSWLCHQ